MTVTNNAQVAAKMGFLKERMIKYWISMAHVPLWILVLGLYYTRGQEYMGSPERRIFQFLIAVNSITLAILLFAGVTEIQSKIDRIYWRCSAVKGEMICLGLIIILQTAAAITLSAGAPTFHCAQQSACAANVFFTVACWVLPILFFVHLLEFVIRARRIATLDPLLWSTVVWLVQWDNPEYYRNAQDMQQTAANTYHNNMDALERGALRNAGASKVERSISNGSSNSSGSDSNRTRREPRMLVLPGLSRIPPIPSPLEAPAPPRYSKVFVKESHQDNRPANSRARSERRSRRQPRQGPHVPSRVIPGEGVILYVPEHIPYTVPTLQPAPKPKAKKSRAPPPPPKSWYH